MTTKAHDLFQAYAENKLPTEGGYIVSSSVSESSPYATYEIVGYRRARAVFLAADRLTFQCDANKLFMVCEPPTYGERSVEPYRRTSHEQIPHRFSDLELFAADDQTRVMVSRQPVLAYGAFTVARPLGMSFVFLFYDIPGVLDTLAGFFTATLEKEGRVPTEVAGRAAAAVVSGVKRFPPRSV